MTHCETDSFFKKGRKGKEKVKVNRPFCTARYAANWAEQLLYILSKKYRRSYKLTNSSLDLEESNICRL
jgi:hypothetical protein